MSNSTSIVAAIGSAVVSVLVVVTMLWNIATNVTLVAKDVQDTKVVVHEMQPRFEQYVKEVDLLKKSQERLLYVDYVGTTYVMIAVTSTNGETHFKIPITRVDTRSDVMVGE